MGATKTELFSEEDNRIAVLAKAIGHPARIAIIKHLAMTKGCICGDLVDVLPLSQSTISQHLKALKVAGIIMGEVEGAKICYCINPITFAETKSYFEVFFDEIKKCC